MARVVTFRLGPDLFGVEATKVERVLRYTSPRTLPRLPEWVDGVIDYGAAVLPVVDLRRRLELPQAEASSASRILVLQLAHERVAAVVDAVTDVREVPDAEIAPPPPMFRGLAAAYLSGVARTARGLLVILEPEELMTARERIVLEEAGHWSNAAE
jgi:purine-binding chemotaxis protein CheW